jgi:Flp pilus assembly protein TadG
METVIIQSARRFISAGRLGGFWRNQRAATAVEFAFIALPFLMLLIAIIEIGLVFMVATALESATDVAARQIRIGALQNQTTAETAAAFKTSICNNMIWMSGSCASNLEVDVRTFTQFQSVALPNPVSSGALLPQNQLQFSLGGPGSIVLVRAYFPWTLMAPMLDKMATQTSNGQIIITSTTTFRNEPYPSNP